MALEQRLERGVRFWMRAYPRRWRAVRGGELAAVVIDLAGPGAARLGWRAALDLLRGGWATRWREHPPVRTWLLYRLVNRRIPARFRAWALDDIDGFWYPLRTYLGGMWWPLLVLAGPLRSQGGLPVPAFVAFFAFMAVVSMFLRPESGRRRARLKHVAPEPGEPLVEGVLVTQEVPGVRATARSALTWAIVLLSVTVVASAAAVAFAPKVLLVVPDPGVQTLGYLRGTNEVIVAPVGGRWVVAAGVLAVAFGSGLLGAALTRRRLRRLLGERVDQPNRVLRPVAPLNRANLLFWAAMLVALAGLEIGGLLVLGASVAVGSVALVLLPGALVALSIIDRCDRTGVSGSDVWRIATRGRSPEIDQPVPALRPLPGPVPDGVIAPTRLPDPPFPGLP